MTIACIMLATRPASIEDKLVVTKFNNSITRGFAAVGEPQVAVCLLPGTELAFDANVECKPSSGSGYMPNKKIGQRLARFRQINMDNPVTHHDAFESPDGQVVLLTRLCDGQRGDSFCKCRLHPEPAGSGKRQSRRRGGCGKLSSRCDRGDTAKWPHANRYPALSPRSAGCRRAAFAL